MRDLNRDLEIIAKATPGKWAVLDEDDGRIVALDERLTTIIEDLDVRHEDARFIAEAREGWQHAIERALKAEAEVERLRDFLEEIASYVNVELAEYIYKVLDGKEETDDA